jgi:asparagine synthase (glutamine-hydrolysing)
MCGIAGIVALDPRRTVDPAPMAGMLARLRHRGPDDEGLHVEPAAVFGHRRLSIIDVAGGHQPLRGRRETTVAVVNGEIYNYRTLARRLEADGSRFRTASDSEVAAHAFDAWDSAFLEQLDGMYALAVWDGAAHRLLLARDRMGEKPLYYARADGLLIFASELSAVLSHPAVPARIDLRALREYLALEYVPAPASMIEGVHKLEPGTALTLERGTISVRRYWSIDPQPEPVARPYREAVLNLRATLEEAVRSRLVSDVPLGVFLSGGLDSSAVAALAARHGALDTFSIGFDEPSFDESAHARLVARHIGSRHHERVLRADDMPDLVPGLGALLDEPLGDASILPTAALSAFARESVTVALGGDGGDELFAGYPMHQGHRVAHGLRGVPATVWHTAAYLAARLPVSHRNFAPGFKLATFLRGVSAPAPARHGRWMASFVPELQRELLHPDVLRATADQDPFAVLERQWQASAGAPLLARASHLDATTYLPDDILMKVDRASMSVGLEVRAPLLARAVVDLAFSLPDTARMRHLTGKRVLRDAVRDLLPAAVLRRPKKGFGMPVAAWLSGSLRPLTRDLLAASDVGGGLFRAEVVERMLMEHDRHIRDHRKPLWTLLVLELWRRHHLAGGHGAPASSPLPPRIASAGWDR